MLSMPKKGGFPVKIAGPVSIVVSVSRFAFGSTSAFMDVKQGNKQTNT